MYLVCICLHAMHLPFHGDAPLQSGSHVTADEEFWLHDGITMRTFQMLRRITWLIPVLALLTLSGCIIFPHGGWHDDHHRYSQSGPGYYPHR
jgi:hypothetical protein